MNMNTCIYIAPVKQKSLEARRESTRSQRSVNSIVILMMTWFDPWPFWTENQSALRDCRCQVSYHSNKRF